MQRVRRTERGRRGESKGEERVEKKKVHDHILLRLGKGWAAHVARRRKKRVARSGGGEA